MRWFGDLYTWYTHLYQTPVEDILARGRVETLPALTHITLHNILFNRDSPKKTPVPQIFFLLSDVKESKIN